MKKLIPITFLSALSAISHAEEAHPAHTQPQASGVEALSPELRHLLSQEMKALQQGMMSIIPAYVSGNWYDIESTAKQIKNSYLLKQSLTDKQKQELHSTLPGGFIEKDKTFHYLAGMLEHVAHEKKPELIHFYFSEMTKACADCHTRFATHKFPGLKTMTQKRHKH